MYIAINEESAPLREQSGREYHQASVLPSIAVRSPREENGSFKVGEVGRKMACGNQVLIKKAGGTCMTLQ